MPNQLFDQNATMSNDTAQLEPTKTYDELMFCYYYFELYPNEARDHADSVEAAVNFWIAGVLNSVIVLLGLFANLLSLFIIRTRLSSRRTQMALYLVILTSWDICVLLIGWLLFSLTALLHSGHTVIAGRSVILKPAFFTLSHITLMGCTLTTCVITIERYAAICHPIWHRKYWSSGIRCTSMCLVFTFSALIGSGRYFQVRLLIS